jgi:uridine kinase
MPQPVIIGIAGGSGSGKSTLLARLVSELGPESVTVIDHDAYYRDLRHLSLAERTLVNFDHPDTLETDLLVEHLDDLLSGRHIEKPVYDFTQHTRSAQTVFLSARPVIIVEGILVLNDDELVRRMDIKLFVDAEDDVRLARRIRRDMSERDRTIDSILKQYEETVRPMFIQFVEPSKRKADIIIPRGGKNLVALDLILTKINSLLAGHEVESLSQALL